MAGLLSGERRREAPVLRIRRVVTQAQLVDGATAQDRMLAQLSGAFGLAGALLVCLGLFGVTAYDVSRRTAEFGIRIALGAQPSSVARMVVRHAIVLVGSGVGFGMVCSVAVTRIAERLVFGVRALDAASLLPPALMLLAIGVAAAYVPARRAASADPATALRWE
jgi:ABC-type antimicrobial peptide transport system permease subunit